MGQEILLPRYSQLLSCLRLSLVIAALCDAVLAGILALAWPWALTQLGLQRVDSPLLSLAVAVLLLIKAALALLAAYDPRAYHGNIVVSIAGSAALATTLFFAGWRYPGVEPFEIVVIQGLQAVAQAVFWVTTRR